MVIHWSLSSLHSWTICEVWRQRSEDVFSVNDHAETALFLFTCLNIVSHKFCWCVVGSVNLSILPRSCLLLISVWTIFYNSFQYSNRIDHFPGYKTLVKQLNHWTCCATFNWHMNCKAFLWSSSLTFSQVFQEITALVSTVPHSKKILGSNPGWGLCMFSLQTLVSPTSWV